MTILYSLYTGEGIVFAADRLITKAAAQGTREFVSTNDPKVFRAPGVGAHNQGALISYFGQAYVGSQPMAVWLRNKIVGYPGSPTLQNFAQHVTDSFRAEAGPVQRKQMLGFHMGGYELHGNQRKPVFYFARNAEINEVTGGYSLLHQDASFDIDEQFLVNCGPASSQQIRSMLRSAAKNNLGIPAWYRNGDVRAFANVTGALEAGIRGLVTQMPGYKVPNSLQKWAALAGLFISAPSATAQIYFSK